MKPWNFPGRKNRRRQGALVRLLVGGEGEPLSRRRMEIAVLRERLSQVAETQRSKKSRAEEKKVG